MTSVSTTTVTDPSSVNTESAGVEDAESSQGGKPAQPEPGNAARGGAEKREKWSCGEEKIGVGQVQSSRGAAGILQQEREKCGVSP